MEHSELQYLADFLVTSFTDIGLIHDYQILAERGQGVIVIDARQGKALCDGQPFPDLLSAGRMSSSFRLELDRDPMMALKEASLEVRFLTERYDRQKDPANKWTSPTGQWVGAVFDCSSRVSTQGLTAKGSHHERLEWPFPLQLDSDWLRKARKPVS